MWRSNQRLERRFFRCKQHNKGYFFSKVYEDKAERNFLLKFALFRHSLSLVHTCRKNRGWCQSGRCD